MIDGIFSFRGCCWVTDSPKVGLFGAKLTINALSVDVATWTEWRQTVKVDRLRVAHGQ